jgi:hypothetical protein
MASGISAARFWIRACMIEVLLFLTRVCHKDRVSFVTTMTKRIERM